MGLWGTAVSCCCGTARLGFQYQYHGDYCAVCYTNVQVQFKVRELKSPSVNVSSYAEKLC